MTIEVTTNVNPIANIEVSTTDPQNPTIGVDVPEAVVIGVDTTVLLGPKGDPGFSPIANVSKTGTTATITITDQVGTTTATVSDGAKGDTGDSGVRVQVDEPTDPDVNVWINPNGTDTPYVTDVKVDDVSVVTDRVANIELPTVNDGTLTIQKNGTTVGTFTANQSTNSTVNIEADVQVNSDWNATSGVAEILNKPSIPSKTSDLTNDSGYITSSYHDSTKQDVLTAGTGIDITDNVISNTQTSAEWGNITGDIDDQTDLQNEFQNLREVAEGKTASYVVSDVTNPSFNTQDASFNISGTFTDINNVSHNVSDLKLGDSIYVIETDVPDRWCSSVVNGTVTLYKLETAKVPVTDVRVLNSSIVSNGIANIPAANSSTAGVIKANTAQAISVNSVNGLIYTNTFTNAQYNSAGNEMFVGKGTLENVITGKGLVNQTQLNTKQDKLTTTGSSTLPVYINGSTPTAITSISGSLVQGGGLHSTISSSDSVSICPAINGAGFCTYHGTTVTVYINNTDIQYPESYQQQLFNGKSDWAFYANQIGATRIKSLYPYDSTATYNTGKIVWDSASSKFYNCLQDGTVGQSLSDTTYWKDVTFGSYLDLTKIDTVTMDILFDSSLSVSNETGLSLYFIGKMYTPDYCDVEKINTSTQASKKINNIPLDATSTIYLGKMGSNFPEHRLIITFHGFSRNNALILEEVAITGNRKDITGTLLSKGGDKVYGTIYPYTNNTIDFGNDICRWRNLYTNTIFLGTSGYSYYVNASKVQAWDAKQNALVSGSNIKTINGQSVLGSGNITIQGTGPNVVQTTGQSTTDVMSQKAVTDATAFKEVIPPTKLLQSNIAQYCTSYYTYTQNQVQNVRVICRQSYNDASVNHYRTGDIKYMSAVGLFKNDNNYLTLYFNGYNLAIRNRKNNVSINEVNLGNFYSALNQPYITSWCAEIDLHNKVIRFLYYNAQTNTMNTFPANTTYDISEWDLSHLDSFNFVYGCSEYTSDSFLYHCYMNGYIDIQEYLSSKINYGEYNSYDVLPKRDTTPLIATEVFANTTSSGAIAGTLVQEYSALHKTFSFNMPTGDGVYMGYNVTTTGNRHSGTTWCMKFKILSCDDTFEFAYRTPMQEIWQGDTHIRDIKWGEATWHPDTNIEYTFVTQASDDLPWTDWLLKGRNGNVVMEVLDVWFMIPQNANICAETYDGTFFAGNLPFLATNVKFKNDYSSIDTSRQYLGIPRYMKYVNNAGDIYMYNGTTWKKVSP